MSAQPKVYIDYEVRKAQVLDIIRDWIEEHGYSPSLQNIALRCEPPYHGRASLKPVIDRMVEEGLLIRGDGPRTLRILEPET